MSFCYKGWWQSKNEFKLYLNIFYGNACDLGQLWNNFPGFSSVQSLSRVWLFATPWIAARQASLSITNSWSSLRLTSIESVMPSSHLLLCRPLLLLPPIPPSIRVFSCESTLPMRWPEYWSFSFSIIPSKEHPVLISFRMINKFTVQIWLIKLISACLFKETEGKEVWFVFN